MPRESIIQIYRSTTASNAPSLTAGELAVNIPDKKLFVGGTSGNITFLDASAHITTVNGLTGAITLTAGSNITLTPVGNTITIASSGGGGGTVYNFIEGATAPTGLTAGDRWFDTNTGKLFTAVTDGASRIWVEFGGVGTQGATGAAAVTNSTTQTLDFTETINGLEIVFYGLGGDYSTSLKYIENYTISNINLQLNSLGNYYAIFTSIKSFYDATNGWSAKLLLKPPFTNVENPLITTTAGSIYANGIQSLFFTPSSVGNEEFWTLFASTTLYHQDATYVTKTVTGQAWVAADSYIECKVLGLTTADHTPEDAILEGVKFEINNIVVGTGFDIIGHAPEGTYGKYTIKCLGQ